MKLAFLLAVAAAAAATLVAPASGQPPVHDLCTDAVSLVPDQTVSGDTINATLDIIDVSCGLQIYSAGPGVWYTFTSASPEAAAVVVSSCSNQTDFDTTVTVFAGSCGALRCVRGQGEPSNKGCGLGASLALLPFLAAPDRQYWVLVGGNEGAVGNFELTLSLPSSPNPPSNDECANAAVVPAVPIFPYPFFVGDISFASSSNYPDRLLSCDTYGREFTSVWFSWTPSVSGTFDFETNHIERLGILTGGCDSLTEVACDSGRNVVRADVHAGETYLIIVESRVDTSPDELRDLTLTINPTRTPPPNDECVAATVIPSALPFPYSNDMMNASFATSNDVDPLLSCTDFQEASTLWYTWTPLVSGRFDIHTNLQAALGIYTGHCGSLTESACSTSIGRGYFFFPNLIHFQVTAGKIYYIKVELFGPVVSDSPPSLSLFVNPTPPAPPNDECVDASVIPSAPSFPYVDYVANVTSATINALDPVLSCTLSNNAGTVWYTWTPAVSGQYNFFVSGDGEYNNVAQNIYTGRCGSLVAEEACDIGGSGLPLDARAGETYILQIELGSNDLTSDGLTLTIDRTPPPPSNDACVDATVIPTAPTFPFIDFVGGVTSGIRDVLDPEPSCTFDGQPAVWYMWAPSVAGRYDLSASPSGNDAFHTFHVAYSIHKGDSCGSLVEVSCESFVNYFQLDVTAGETYFIRIVVLRSGRFVSDLTFTANPTPSPSVAPVTAPTRSPVRVSTTAPIRAPTTAPTKAPVRGAPIRAPTNAPAKVPVLAPVRAPTTAPIRAPTNAPANGPALATVRAPTMAPIAASCAVSYNVYNGKNEAFFSSLVDGSIIATPPCGVNIEAAVSCKPVLTGAVTLLLRSSANITVATRIERTSPYFLFGDLNGDIFSGTVAPGTYTVRTQIGGVDSPWITFTFGTCVA